MKMTLARALLGVLALLCPRFFGSALAAQPQECDLMGVLCFLEKEVGTGLHEPVTESVLCSIWTQNLQPKPSQIEFSAQETAKLKVQNLSGDPHCYWTQNEGRIVNTSTERGVYSVYINESGIYKLYCAWKSENCSVVFNIHPPRERRPSTPQLKIFYVGKGYGYKFICSSSGLPKPKVTWFYSLTDRRNGETGEETKDSGSTWTSSSVYVFDYNDRDVFCCAKNHLGEECSKLKAYALQKSANEQEASLVSLIVGESLLLQCKHSLTSLWQNDTAIAKGILYSDKIYKIYYSYLFVDSVTKNHSATYTCVSPSDGKKKSTHVQVLEHGFLKILKLDEAIYISTSESKFYCLQAEVFSYPEAHCHWITPYETVPCTEPSWYWGNRTFKYCNPIPGEYQFIVENNEMATTRNISYCVVDVISVTMQRDADRISCSANSTVPMNLTWRYCPLSSKCEMWTEETAHTLNMSDLPEFCHKSIYTSLQLSDLKNNVIIMCCIKNSLNYKCSDGIAIQVPENILHLLLSVSIPFVGLLIVCCAGFLYILRKKKPLYECQLQILQMVGQSNNDYIYINFKDFNYDSKWEFPRDKLMLGKELGSGAFGKVVQATAYGLSMEDMPVQVAVKMLKEKHQQEEREALMSELKMLIHIGNHDNILNLLGACTSSGPVYLIFQYCYNGDLLNYLKNNRENFQKSLTDNLNDNCLNNLYHNLQLDNPFRENTNRSSSIYVPMSPVLPKSYEKLLQVDIARTKKGDRIHEESVSLKEELQILTYNDLLIFAYEVAKGMEFLSSKNCIHRDLAARNVLVTHDKIAKIGDFGLARDIENDSNYVVRGNVWLPVKWMAPESLFKGVYTMQSDIWSYGILLWEIFSLGVTPYPGIKVDQRFYAQIENGFQMDKPYHASDSVYKIMCLCWALKPQDRPQFSDLRAIMETQLKISEDRLYAYVEEASKQNIYQNGGLMFDQVPDGGHELLSRSKVDAENSPSEEVESPPSPACSITELTPLKEQE